MDTFFTITYRGQPVHFSHEERREKCSWGVNEYWNQKSAHTAINEMLGDKADDHSILPTLKQEIRSGDMGDPHGTCMGWMFALADYMTECYFGPPEEWKFRQGMGGVDDESWEYQSLELFQPTEDECDQLAELLHRWDRKNRCAGRDY